MLPEIKMPEETVEVAGELVTLRALTIYEVRRLKNHPSEDESDALAVHLSTGASMAEATAWLESVPASVAVEVMAAIFRVSGLTEGAQFPS